MNSKLQVSMLKKTFAKANPGVDPSSIDWDNMIDPNLTYHENLEGIKKDEALGAYNWKSPPPSPRAPTVKRVKSAPAPAPRPAAAPKPQAPVQRKGIVGFFQRRYNNYKEGRKFKALEEKYRRQAELKYREAYARERVRRAPSYARAQVHAEIQAARSYRPVARRPAPSSYRQRPSAPYTPPFMRPTSKYRLRY